MKGIYLVFAWHAHDCGAGLNSLQEFAEDISEAKASVNRLIAGDSDFDSFEIVDLVNPDESAWLDDSGAWVRSGYVREQERKLANLLARLQIDGATGPATKAIKKGGRL